MEHLADGIVITPSQIPPEDGGFKYNPTNGGPADTDVTGWVQDRANELLRGGSSGVKRVPLTRQHPAGHRVHSLDRCEGSGNNGNLGPRSSAHDQGRR